MKRVIICICIGVCLLGVPSVASAASNAENLLKVCLAREQELPSGHLQFKCIYVGPDGVGEKWELYFEWKPKRKVRVGYSDKPKELLAVSDGERSFVPDSDFPWMIFNPGRLERWDEPRHITQHLIFYMHVWPIAHSVDVVPRPLNISDRNLPRRIISNNRVIMWHEFQQDYRSLRGNCLILADDGPDVAFALNKAFEDGFEPSGVLASVFLIDESNHMPREQWVIAEAVAGGVLEAEYMGAVGLDGHVIPQGSVFYLNAEERLHLVLDAENSYIGEVPDERFVTPNPPLKERLDNVSTYFIEYGLANAIESVLTFPGNCIVLAVLGSFFAVLRLRKGQKEKRKLEGEPTPESEIEDGS